MTRSLGLTLAGAGIMFLWSAWANVNPWDEFRAALSPQPVRPLQTGKPTKATR